MYLKCGISPQIREVKRIKERTKGKMINSFVVDILLVYKVLYFIFFVLTI